MHRTSVDDRGRGRAVAVGVGVGVAVAAALALAAACSLVVERSPNQCKTDDDCARFGGHPFCRDGICVASGLGPPGCFYGTPSTEENILNQCTTGTCEPFDNCAKLKLCSGAALPALLTPPDAGVPPKPDTSPPKPDAKVGDQ